jgi:acyl carrier protein
VVFEEEAMPNQEIRKRLKEYIEEEFLHDAETIEDGTPLISGGIVDSFSLVDLALFVEEQWGVKLENTELNADYLDTLADAEQLISSKLL